MAHNDDGSWVQELIDALSSRGKGIPRAAHRATHGDLRPAGNLARRTMGNVARGHLAAGRETLGALDAAGRGYAGAVKNSAEEFGRGVAGTPRAAHRATHGDLGPLVDVVGALNPVQNVNEEILKKIWAALTGDDNAADGPSFGFNESLPEPRGRRVTAKHFGEQDMDIANSEWAVDTAGNNDTAAFGGGDAWLVDPITGRKVSTAHTQAGYQMLNAARNQLDGSKAQKAFDQSTRKYAAQDAHPRAGEPGFIGPVRPKSKLTRAKVKKMSFAEQVRLAKRHKGLGN